MKWSEFQKSAPDLARLVEERFARTGVALLGTIRQDGSPRISAIEPVISHDEFLLGMMWRSRKALDLIRDPRCVIHSIIADPSGSDGEVKLYGQAIERQDSDEGGWRHQLFRERWGASAPEAFHAFTVEIESAAYIAYDIAASQMTVTQWDTQRGVREMSRAYP
jgi:pyridoxamine 5'-phosphate oxidase-like protein